MSRKPSILESRIDAAGWRRIPRLNARLEQAAQATLAALPKRFHFPWTVTLLLTSDAAVKKLNQDFRGLGKATNVLSFPQFEAEDLPKNGRGNEPVPMGDIVMGYQYIVGEANTNHKLLINHIMHLFIHGILHLFGYDHHSELQAARMENLEKKIMSSLNLPDPYMSGTKATRKK